MGFALIKPQVGMKVLSQVFFPSIQEVKGDLILQDRVFWKECVTCLYSAHISIRREALSRISHKRGIFYKTGKGAGRKEGRNARLEARLAGEESKQKIRRKTKKHSTARGSSELMLLFSCIEVNKVITVLIWTFFFSFPNTGSKFSTWALMFLHSFSEKWGCG